MFVLIQQAFANMTLNVRQELCAVMVFAVVDKAGSVVMENGEEVCFMASFDHFHDTSSTFTNCFFVIIILYGLHI